MTMLNETLSLKTANDNAKPVVLVPAVCNCHRCNVCNNCGERRAVDDGLCGGCIEDALALCEERRNWQGDDNGV
jgi:hypothetical protein